MEEAIKEGPYKSYKGSPISKGEFQHNMWGIKDDELSGRWDWDGLRKEIKKNGVKTHYWLHLCLLLQPLKYLETMNVLSLIHQTYTQEEFFQVNLLL